LQLIKNVKLNIINSRNVVRLKLLSKKQYVTQRAKNAYLALICQSKTSFDLFVAAQLIDHSFSDITILNKRLQWQIDNHIKELKFVKLDLTKLRLIVFIDSFFVNNRDLFSQIDYVIYLANSNHAKIVHWSSTKCKRVTRNVLTTKLYALAHDFDLDAILKEIVSNIFKRLISLIFCINFKSLYDCLIRLETTQKKRFIIDVMCLRQSYERRKIIEVKWIHEVNNLVDSMIKSKASTTLKILIDINTINLNTTKWVERNDIDQ
jgi:hypothetical protein